MLVRIVAALLILLVAFCALFVRTETSLDYIPIRYTMYKYEAYDVFRRAAGRSFEKKWNRAHPDRRIKTFYEPIAQPYPTKLNTNVVAGTVHDLFFVPDYFKYAEQGTLLDIKPFIEKYNDQAYFNEIYPNVMEPLYYKGGLYALPGNLNTEVLYYNKRLFRKAGVPYPNEDWTWNDLIEAARKLTIREENGRLVQYGVSPTAMERTIVWNDGRVWSEDLNHCVINSPRAVAAVRFLADLQQKYQVAPTPKDQKVMGASDAFKSNRAAMLIGGRWWTAVFWELSDVEWSVAPLPRSYAGLRRSQSSYNVLGISAKTRHPDIAYEFIKYLCSPEQIHNLVRVGDSIPLRYAPKYNEYFLNEPRSEKGANQAYLDVMKDSIAHLSSYMLHPEVPVQEQRQLLQINTDGIWLGQKGVKQALDDTQAALQRQLEDIRSPAREQSPLWFLVSLAVLLIGVPAGLYMRRAKTAKETN